MAKRDRLEAIFVALDADGNGVIEKIDLILVAKKVAEFSHAPEGSAAHIAIVAGYEEIWKGLSSAADTNKDNKVSREEFFAFWDKIFHTAKTYEDFPVFWKAIVENSFHSTDLNGNGNISESEYPKIFVRYLKAYTASTGKAEGAAEGYAYLAKLGGGQVTLEAFQKASAHSLFDEDPTAWNAFPFAATKL